MMYYLNADMMLFGTFHLSTQLIQIVFIISALTSVANGHFYFFFLSLFISLLTSSRSGFCLSQPLLLTIANVVNKNEKKFLRYH